MLYALFDHLANTISGFNVFRYLTFRAILGALTALAVALASGPALIRWLDRRQVGEQIRPEGPEAHLAKAGTPTMGGTIILVAILLATLLWADLTNRYVWILLLTTTAFGVIGFVDDFLKVRLASGLRARTKFFWQLLVGSAAGASLYYTAVTPMETTYIVPFLKDVGLDFGVLFIPLTLLVIVGSSNAVNLTDGLDGLAILPTVLVAGALGIFAYVTGNQIFANYLGIPYVFGVGEGGVFCGAIVGAGLGFLWFNTYPAQVFMGDVGALALGAALGTMAVVVRQELVLFVMGGVFVMETVSVILQVTSFRLTGKRIFQMAPLHHHYELKGWPEPRVIVRFWIITFVLVLLGLATLKLR